MRYELTIDAEYLSGAQGWNMAAGIREILQNGRDAEIEQAAPLSVSWYNNTLRVENVGAVLSRDALLLGRTTKRDRPDLAGRWGEGLKLGALALVRAGHPVKIRSGGEVWVPAVEPSEKFNGRPVLVFDIQGGREVRNRVRVEIANVTAEDWAALKEHFLFLNKREIPRVDTQYGSLLTGDKFRGRIYVKGILVETDPKLQYGYDLADAELDRDRRIIARWDLIHRLRRIWEAALAARPDLFGAYFSMLDEQARDLEGVDHWNVNSLPAEARAFVATQFADRHGADAVPVENLAQSREIEHLGKRGIVVASKPLAAVLGAVLGDSTSLREKLRQEVVRCYSWHELTETERANLESAAKLVDNVEHVVLDEIDIVDFRSADLWGQFKEGRVLIAHKLLADRAKTLSTLVHEVAHRNGGDGEKNHVAEIERIWSGIVEGLR